MSQKFFVSEPIVPTGDTLGIIIEKKVGGTAGAVVKVIRDMDRELKRIIVR